MSAPEPSPASPPTAELKGPPPHEAIKAVRLRQLVFGLAFFAVGLELLGNQGAWIQPRTSLGAMALLALAMGLNWACPKCRAFLWVDSRKSIATGRSGPLTCQGCRTRYP